MRVGDVLHSSKKVSFEAYDPIREQLESLTSMVYNMSIQKEENNRPCKPQIYQQKRGRGQSRQKDLTSNVIFEGDKVEDVYFDKCDGIYAEISQATRFDESTDLSTTYLGKTDMMKNQIIKEEEKILISGQGYMDGTLLDNTE